MATRAWCTKCEEYHTAFCTKTTEKRRRQNREAQQRYRERKKQQDMDGANKKSLQEIERLRKQVRQFEVENNTSLQEIERLRQQVQELEVKLTVVRGMGGGKGDVKREDFFGGTDKRAAKSTISFLHPDKHNGNKHATRLTQIAIKLAGL